MCACSGGSRCVPATLSRRSASYDGVPRAIRRLAGPDRSADAFVQVERRSVRRGRRADVPLELGTLPFALVHMLVPVVVAALALGCRLLCRH
jgi:hypothetical protein